MNTTKFKSTAEAAAHLAGNPEAARAVQEEICRGSLVSALISMRLAKKMTQEDVAESMGCDPSKISRLEAGNDIHLKWSDIVGYVSAVNVQMSVIFDDDSLPPAVRIKQCVYQIDDDLKRLREMVQKLDGDEKTAAKIAHFYQEVLFNFLKRFSDNHQILKNYVQIPPRTKTAELVECSEVPQESEPKSQSVE
jgi:transcriptional regulator with XRE-family HTH domain